jgi:hypothetical protein
MRVPTPLLLVLFAISAAVEAYVIPKGGKCPRFIANSPCELTIVPLTGDGYRRVADEDLCVSPISGLY